MIEVGKVCLKIAGREAGKYCVVVKKIDKNFVEITGPKNVTGVKRRRVNILHLEELPYKLDIKEGASDAEVLEAWKKSNLLKKLGLKIKPQKIEKETKKVEKKEKIKKEKKKE
jgi:large subunit ribosomal protein L14e